MKLPVAIIGAGGIGSKHAEVVARSAHAAVAAIVDPSDSAAGLADRLGAPWFADYREMLGAMPARAAIVATPNSSHAEIGIACIAAGLPVLVEKPIADTVAGAQRLCDAATAAGLPVLVGHQRRHNPILRHARALLQQGAVGRPVSVTAMATWLKPDAYFDAEWRRRPGGGPVLINLIHDIDLLRFLLGEIASVQAATSSAVRGFDVEDTAAVLLRFACGALGTVSVSDATAAPWNWDLAAGEAAHFPQQHVDSHYIAGTEGSLTLPGLQFWRYKGSAGWHDPLTLEQTALHRADPYDEQMRHFCAVAAGLEAPLTSGLDGLRTLQATLAVHEAARSGRLEILPTC